MEEKYINRNPMIIRQRKEIRQTNAEIVKARSEGKIKKACDLRKKLNRQQRDLNAAIYHLIDAGWINE